MAYGPKYQEDFSYFYLRIAGGGLKNPIMRHILTPVDDHNLYSNGHTVAQPVTMSVGEHPRRRPITLPVVRVRVEVSPVPLVGAPSRAFVGWR